MILPLPVLKQPRAGHLLIPDSQAIHNYFYFHFRPHYRAHPQSFTLQIRESTTAQQNPSRGLPYDVLQFYWDPRGRLRCLLGEVL